MRMITVPGTDAKPGEVDVQGNIKAGETFEVQAGLVRFAAQTVDVGYRSDGYTIGSRRTS